MLNKEHKNYGSVKNVPLNCLCLIKYCIIFNFVLIDVNFPLIHSLRISAQVTLIIYKHTANDIDLDSHSCEVYIAVNDAVEIPSFFKTYYVKNCIISFNNKVFE